MCLRSASICVPERGRSHPHSHMRSFTGSWLLLNQQGLFSLCTMTVTLSVGLWVWHSTAMYPFPQGHMKQPVTPQSLELPTVVSSLLVLRPCAHSFSRMSQDYGYMLQNLQIWLLSLSKLWLSFLPAAACVSSRRRPLLSGTLWHSILCHSFVAEQLDCFLVVMPRAAVSMLAWHSE